MAARTYELNTSRALRFDADNPGTDFRYIVTGAADRSAALLAIALAAPYQFENFVRLPDFRADPQGGGVWEATVPYGLPRAGNPSGLFPGEAPPSGFDAVNPALPDMTNPGPSGSPFDENDPFTGTFPGSDSSVGSQQEQTETGPLGPEWSFTTTGGTKKVTTALTDAKRGGVASRYFGSAVDPSVIDFKSAVGVRRSDKKFEVEGVEAPEPKLEFTTTRNVASVSFKYVRLLVWLTGTVNSRPFGSYKAGELLFLGAEGQYKPPSGQQDQGGWTITYKFAASPQLGPFTAAYKIGDGINLPIGEIKEGWDLIDVLYEDEASGGRLVPRPRQFAIHRIFPRADFRYLGFSKYEF